MFPRVVVAIPMVLLPEEEVLKTMSLLAAHAVVKGPFDDVPQAAAVTRFVAPFVFQYNCALASLAAKIAVRSGSRKNVRAVTFRRGACLFFMACERLGVMWMDVFCYEIVSGAQRRRWQFAAPG